MPKFTAKLTSEGLTSGAVDNGRRRQSVLALCIMHPELELEEHDYRSKFR